MPKTMQAVDPSERIKIAQLQNEMKDTKDKVEWLYNGNKVDREAYLLGKPIDKLVTETTATETKETFAFASTVDLANKIRDDPLFEIKKQEIEAKKRLLENPMKLKQLKEMISKAEGKGKESSRHRRRSSSSDRSSRRSSSRHRKKSHKKHKKENKRERRSSRSKERSSRRERTRSRSNERGSRRERTRSRSRSEDRRRHENGDYYGYKRREKRSPSPEVSAAHTQKIEEIKKYKQKIEDLKKIREKGRETGGSGYDRNKPRESTKKMSEEERQKRLQEMSENAKWRNENRDKNVTKYKSENKKEEEEVGIKMGDTADMFSSMMRDAYMSTEDRIRRNVKNIQRNESAFEKNFAKK